MSYAPAPVPVSPEDIPDYLYRELQKIRDEFYGALTGWRDLRTATTAGRIPASNFPTLANFGPTGNIQQLSFGIDDYVYIASHVDHDMKQGSTVYPHVHWTTNGINTGLVKWELSYTIAAGHNTDAFVADATVNLEEAGSGTAWQHMVTEDDVGFTAPEVDSLVVMKLRRVTPTTGSNGDTVFGLFVDLHYEAEGYATPNRAPNFYE